MAPGEWPRPGAVPRPSLPTPRRQSEQTRGLRRGHHLTVARTQMEVKFALGAWDGLRSSTWKVWGGADGSVYIADRSIGRASKVSLHPRDPDRPGGEWRVAFSSDEVAATALPDTPLPGGRVIASWDSEETRLATAPLRAAYAVVLGRHSLGYQPLPEDLESRERVRRHRTKGVDWSTPMPSLDELWQFTVFITDPHVVSSPPGTRALGAVPVGGFVLPSSEQVWVMRHLIPYTDDMKADVAEKMRVAVNAGRRPESPLVRRVHLLGKEESGLRWTVEVAATFGPIPPELESF